MAPLPTESRIFADRYMRDLRHREAVLADRIAPGTSKWADAVMAFFEQVGNDGSPVKRAARIHRLTGYLNEHIADGAHFLLDCGGSKRSAGLMFATLSAGENPFMGVTEEGVLVTKHMIFTQRNGAVRVQPDVCIAYICKHAIGRLHERGHDLTNMKATCVLACVGVLGLLTRDSEKHIDSGLCLNYDNTLIVGSLKHARKNLYDDVDINGTLYDVRTALPIDETTNREMYTQGAYATHAVAEWLDDRSIDKRRNIKLAEKIPYLTAREDYTTLNAVPETRSKAQ